MTYKVTMLFNQGVNGWSESWYWNPPSVLSVTPPELIINPGPINHNAALDDWYQVFQQRVFLLNKTAYMAAVRFSDVDIPRSGFLDESVQTLQQLNSNERDVKRTALLALAEAGSYGEYKRQVMLRGIPDAWTIYDQFGAPKFDAVFGPFSPFVKALIKARAAMRILRKDLPTGTNPLKTITAVTRDPTSGQVTITCPGHGFSTGTQVRIRGALFLDAPLNPGINGVWRVLIPPSSTDPVNSFQIDSILGSTFAAMQYIGSGTAQARRIEYENITDIRLDDFATHRTGAAFFAGRGRSRTRKALP